jgi:hypothetical protein
MGFGQVFRKWLRDARARAAKSRADTYKRLRGRLRALAQFRQQ